jgi:hypothetical protein
MTRRRVHLLLMVGLLATVAVFALGAGAAEEPTHDGAAHGDEHGPGLAIFETPEPITGTGVMPPALWLIGGALLLPWLPRRLRPAVAVAAPAVALWSVITQIEPGTSVTAPFLEYTLQFVRADRLSIVFGMIFSLVGVIAGT